MNEFGFLNLRRFAGLIQNLSSNDFDFYRNSRKNLLEPIARKVSAIHLNNNNNNGDETKSAVHSEPRFSDFMEMKDQYYTQHLGDRKLADFEQMSVNYAKMVQWTLFYYYRDTCSWNEFYPYDCVPFVSDFVDIHKANLLLEFNKPVNVFTHLLAILPSRSAHLLPRCYQMEMFNDLKIPVCPFAFYISVFHCLFDDFVFQHWDNLMKKSSCAELKLQPEDEERNTERPMVKLKYDGLVKSSNCVKVTEIHVEKVKIRKNMESSIS